MFRSQMIGKRSRHTDSAQVYRLEVVDTGRRRRWSFEEKLRIVEESHQGHRQVSATARRHGISDSGSNVSNCIALSTTHHAAFDNKPIGISLDGIIHVSKRLLKIRDGPILELGIKQIEVTQL